MDQTKYTCSKMWPAGHQFTICPIIFPPRTMRISLFVAFWLDLLGRKANKNIFSKHLISYILIWFGILLIHLLPQKVLGKLFTHNFFYLRTKKQFVYVCLCVPAYIVQCVLLFLKNCTIYYYQIVFGGRDCKVFLMDCIPQLNICVHGSLYHWGLFTKHCSHFPQAFSRRKFQWKKKNSLPLYPVRT